MKNPIAKLNMSKKQIEGALQGFGANLGNRARNVYNELTSVPFKPMNDKGIHGGLRKPKK